MSTQQTGPITAVSNPLNLLLTVRDTAAGFPNTGVINPPPDGVPNVINNFIQLQLTLAKNGIGLNTILTVHFARANFVNRIELLPADQLEIDPKYIPLFEPGDVVDGKLTCYYEKAYVITAYDNNFNDYISDFAQSVYLAFNALFIFFEAPEDVTPVQKNIVAFTKFINDNDQSSSAFTSGYPLISVVQTIQDSKRRGAPYTNVEVPAAAPSLKPNKLDLADIQGLIVRGYRVPLFRNFICTIKDAAAVKSVIAKMISGDSQYPQITSAEIPETLTEKPKYFLNMSFTYVGLKNMDLNTGQDLAQAFASFPSFIEGAAARANFVGDTGSSSPEHWKAGLGTDSTQVIVTLYARSPLVREEKSAVLRKMFEGALDIVAELDGVTFPDGRIHFGYKDGIAQPTINAINAPERPLEGDQSKMEPYNLILTGHNKLPLDPSPYTIPDVIGCNGSFGAFRVLKQDVKGFDAYLNSQSETIDPELLAAKFCGRWRNGQPLEQSPNSPVPMSPNDDLNNFNYYTDAHGQFDDFEGSRCPIGAHIRRANPRDAIVASPVEHHRVMRRAMSYGPPYNPKKPDSNDAERGLIGFFIGASVENSFEFIMRDWFNDSTFAPDLPFENTDLPDGIVGSRDPLLGTNCTDTSVFDVVKGDHQGTTKIEGFPRFITTRGGAYCFFPGMSALNSMTE